MIRKGIHRKPKLTMKNRQKYGSSTKVNITRALLNPNHKWL